MASPLHPSDDRLIDLVERLLPTEEAQSVLAHLEMCTQCEERFRVLLREHETAKRTERPRLGADDVLTGARSKTHRSTARLRVAVVAAAATAAVVWYFAFERAPNSAYWIPFEFDSSSLRSTDSIAAGSSAAFQAYENHDARTTISLLRDAPATDDEMISSLQQLMLASALVNAGQPAEALDVLEELQVFSLPVGWRRHGRWVEYLALRDSGRIQEAEEHLRELAKDPGDVGSRARDEQLRRKKN